VALSFKKLLINLEDELNGEVENDIIAPKLQLALNVLEFDESVEFVEKPKDQIIIKDIPNKEHLFSKKEEIKPRKIVKKERSGMFYKVTNHFNLVSLANHFSEWIEQKQKFFSFHHFIDFSDAFEAVISLAAYYEHRESKKVLVISSFHEYGSFFGSKGVMESSEFDPDLNVYKVGDYINLMNFHELTLCRGLSCVSGYEKAMDDLSSSYDLLLVIYPPNIHLDKVSDPAKALMLKCSNVSYFLDKKGTSNRKLKTVRTFFKETGINEGGVIIGGAHD